MQNIIQSKLPAVITLFHSNYQSLADLVMPNWNKYCNYNNYNLICHVGEYGPGQIGFQKIRFLYDQMFVENKTDLALMLDLDILFTNFNIKIENYIDNKHSYFVTTDIHFINNGSFILCKTPAAQEILQYILSFSNSMPNEQDVLKNNINSENLLKNNIKILENPSINSLDYSIYPEFVEYAKTEKGQWQPNHLLVHFPGKNLNDRINIINNSYSQYINHSENK